MAKYGVFMLEKLVLQYCPSGGSSRGMRAFVQHMLPALEEAQPQIECQAKTVSGRHPFLIAYYRNGRSKPVCVKNADPAAIQDAVYWLRSSHGRGQDDKVVSRRLVSRNPSVQGPHSGHTFASELEAENARRARVLAAQLAGTQGKQAGQAR
uniref:Large ribosomal subunit protein mL43 n=1 Tax=Chlamydomonas leiostraca TaxID=1034604 RepID=A0A7S0RL48_9CHLO|mmetsp:Transcript_2488/g.6402  ORF Transcript_2488/g.6402 Transcript_2488/m.6402 type:complete len:152 (+) Transcript_2488:119-574(+)|eukprot:CAMPEP_0202869624 /NCGR_PEP_ID=MMETSP1391-20130828/12557_1 /ASSEMBLY_ACC=CAM_ASM_000867 /TAXON_ID=1034604 /ORGANISM="Chlamydomonas leiostraca, Strain SAG 11-49" /LENGTH=151 /DNA_ID=CAMNT_0049549961 /DNA_START=109 /DNA_END=564 /DNA_ORIENTATION=+